MKPLVVYTKASTKWIQKLLDLGDRLDFVDVFDPTAHAAPNRVAYFRIPDDPGGEAAMEALRIAKALRARGARVVNDPKLKLGRMGKADCYSVLRRAGIRTPACISNPTIHQIMFALESGDLSFPFLLRRQNSLNGIGTDMVRGESQLKPILERHRVSGWQFMACEWIDAKGLDGLYWKWRPYVFGGKVDMWEAGNAKVWMVNLADNQSVDAPRFRAANEMAAWPRKWDVLMETAAESLRLDVCAFDVLLDPKNPRLPIITDINETYGMTADLLPLDLFSPKTKLERAGHYTRLADWLETLA